jgi:hypothetical protein
MIACVHSFFRGLLPLLASLAGLVVTGFASGTCHFLERDFYVTPQRGPEDYFLNFGGCENYFTVEECSQCYENPNTCALDFPLIVPEDYDKETQGIGFWNMERFTGYASSDPPGVQEMSNGPSCQLWPNDAIEDFDGYWLYGRIMSLMTIFSGILAVVLVYFACAQGMMVKPFLIGLHLALGVFTVLLLIAIKSDLCSDSGLALVEFESEGGEFYEFPVAGCHAGTGQKLVLGAFCCWILGAIGVWVAYKDPNESSILDKWAKITAASERATKQTTFVVPYQEEEKKNVASASGPMEPIADTLGPVDGAGRV